MTDRRQNLNLSFASGADNSKVSLGSKHNPLKLTLPKPANASRPQQAKKKTSSKERRPAQKQAPSKVDVRASANSREREREFSRAFEE